MMGRDEAHKFMHLEVLSAKVAAIRE